MQQIQLNIISFAPLVDNLTFAFYGERQKRHEQYIQIQKYFPRRPKKLIL